MALVSAALSLIPVPPKIDKLVNPYNKLKVTEVYCHADLVVPLTQAFQCIIDNNLTEELTEYNGCYNYRNIAGTDRLSYHAYGKAIDINASKPIQPAGIVKCFKDVGFTWGGDWEHKPDPMHFEWRK